MSGIKSEDFLNPNKHRVGVLDIEATGLTGDYHVGLCAVIKTQGRKEYKTYRLDDSLSFDTDILKAEAVMLNEMMIEDEYDGVITYYGSRYDIPMLRTRMITQGIPPIGKIHHLDMYYTVRRSVALTSNRMASVNELLKRQKKNITGKTRIGPEYWQSAIYSRNKKSMDYIVDHCKRDVDVLQNIVNEFRPFIPERIVRM